MQLHLFVVSKDKRIYDCVGRLKEGAVPRDTLEKLEKIGTKLKVRGLLLSGQNYDDIAASILEITPNSDDVTMLNIGDTGDLAGLVTPHILVHETSEDVLKNPKNFLGSAYANLLRRYIRVREKYQDRGYRKIMLLPQKNCDSEDLGEFFSLSNFEGSHGAFSGELDSRLATLRSRMKPKKKTSDPSAYFVDESNLHFQLAYERHAKASDSCPPHGLGCVLGIHFRLGMRIDRCDHYNVSNETDFISGAFTDCHDEPVLVKATTHLNMFPNGQF